MRVIRDCNVVVVGGAGFLGSHLTDHLINDRGCKVLVIDDLSSGRLEFLHNRATFDRRDISGDEAILKGVFASWGAKYVFNYAAMPYVPNSYTHPIKVFAVNAMGAMKVINAAQEAGAEAILQVSSAELYGEGQRGSYHATSAGEWGKDLANKIDEEGAVKPHSSYGASKAAVDYFCQAAYKERKTPVIALRQFNCYGPRPLHDYVIPTIISQLHRTGTKIKLGNNASRDFQYAGDAVKMAVELLEKGEFGSVYNMGSETSIPVYDLAQKISDVMGCGRVTIEQDPNRIRKWEIWNLTSDNSKLYSVIKGQPKTSFEEGLRLTIESFRKNGNRWSFEVV